MGELLLCKEPIAAMPYYIDSRCYLLPYIGISDKGNNTSLICS